MGWSEEKTNKSGVIGLSDRIRSFKRHFIAGAAGAVADSSPIESSGHIDYLAVKMDADNPPASVIVTITDREGLLLFPPMTFAISERQEVSPPAPFTNGCDISVSGTMAEGDEADIIAYVF